jgi:hypothetical protein
LFIGENSRSHSFSFFGFAIEQGKTVALFSSADNLVKEAEGRFPPQLSVQIFSKDIYV